MATLEAMSVPHVVLVSYLVLGMITTASVWQSMALEIEMSIDMEDDDVHGPLRAFLTIMFVLTWPLVLYEVVKRG